MTIMYVTGLILNISVSIIFFLSGVLKLFSLKQVSDSLLDTTVMPEILNNIFGKTSKKVLEIISVLFPLFEICLSIMLITYEYKILINCVVILVLFLFIFINLKSIKERTSKKCYCFGKFGDSQLGYGGFFQSVFLFLCLLPAIILQNINLRELSNYDSKIIIIIALLLFSILMILRKLIDELSGRLIT